MKRQYSVVVVGAGQAGLSASHHLKQAGIEHIVLEKAEPGHAWRNERWDTFCLVTPNWQCQLPGFPYDGPEPNGFMKKDEIVAYLERYRAWVKPPLECGVEVLRIAKHADAFSVHTSHGTITAEHVIFSGGSLSHGHHSTVCQRVAE